MTKDALFDPTAPPIWEVLERLRKSIPEVEWDARKRKGNRQGVTTMADLPKAVWEGTFHVFGVDVKCAVLDDGTRLIREESLTALFQAMAQPGVETGDITAFACWEKTGELPPDKEHRQCLT